jgi:hypothetical protein
MPSPRYSSVFGDQPRAPVDQKSAHAAITAKLAEFGVELSSAGAKWPVPLLDQYLARQNVSVENRMMVKSLLRQIDSLE